MRKHLSGIVTLVIAGALVACSSAPTPKGLPAYNDAGHARVFNADLDTLIGPTWRGTLTYLNYGSDKLSTIPTSLLVARTGEAAWSWATGYDDEPHADSASEVRLIEGGQAIQSGDTIERVVSRVREGDRLSFMTEHADADDNRPATIRREYRIGPGEFSIRKLVKYEGEGDFFQRHEYRWKR